MDKARIQTIANEALRELEFQTWSVSTVWRKKKNEGQTSLLKTINSTSDWVVDFNNDEGTFPRVFFYYKEEDGEVWVKREIKRQLVDLKERARLQNWHPTPDKTNSSIPSANSNTFVEFPPPSARRQGRNPSRPSAKATNENYATARDAAHDVEPNITAQLPAAFPAQGNSSPTLEKTTLPIRRPRSSYQTIVRKSMLVTATVVVVAGLISVSQLKNSRTAASTPVEQKIEPQVNHNLPIEPSPSATFEKAKIVVPDWPSLNAVSSPTPLQPSDDGQSATADTRVAKEKWATGPKTQRRVRPFASWSPAPEGKPSPIDDVPAAFSKIRKNATHADLNEAIHNWATAYGNQDVRREISFYAGNVTEYKSNRNIPRDDIEFDKERLVDRSKDVKITVGEPIISSDPAGYTARVIVSKSVTSKNGEKTEEGTKEIRWQKTRAGWKIVGEKDLILAQ